MVLDSTFAGSDQEAEEMITVRRSEERGHANHGWLDTYHTFSFADYHDPDHMHFGPLRVINQDRVEAGRGFGTHGHKDMEIVSYVLDGVLEHEDSMGNGSQMRPGDVQIMSAGSGVTHSEFNGSPDEDLHFLQMWIFPRTKDTEPRYEQKAFPDEERRGRLRLVVSPDGDEGSLTIDQDVRLYAGLLGSAEEARHELAADRAAWLHVARGRLEVNGTELGPGDGAAIRDESAVVVHGREDAELVLWDLPA
jgi:redox-sensitive bicupin YhaK (pirin superfamily)